MGPSVADSVVDAIGFGAGLFVSASLVPQIYRAHKRRSTRDLSYFWQGIIAAGVALQLVYLAYFDMWSVFVPLTFELIFVLYLIGLKNFFDSSSHEGTKVLQDENTTADIDAAGEGVAAEADAPDSHSRVDTNDRRTT